MPKSVHIVFTGGVTAGHLFPGLAVADVLRTHPERPNITFIGSGRPMEVEHVANAGFHYLSVKCAPWPRRVLHIPQFVSNNYRGYCEARRFLRAERVTTVVGLGGYASAPTIRAAIGRRIPLVLLEQNSTAGRVTRWAARRAHCVCAPFVELAQSLPKNARLRITGNPIWMRDTVKNLDHRETLLLLGGSQGARSLNEHLPDALAKIRGQLNSLRIVHQTGQADVDRTSSRYQALGLLADVTPFINDIPSMLKTTRLAICRAGGSTIAELAAHGVPSILVPLPNSAGDHQRKNADSLVAGGACQMVEEGPDEKLFDSRLATAISSLLSSDTQREQLSCGIRGHHRPDAALRVAQLVAELAGLLPVQKDNGRKAAEIAPGMCNVR